MQNNKSIMLANFRMLEFVLINSFAEIDSSEAFKGAIQGHFVQYGSFADDRIAMVEQKIKEIIRE